MLERISWAASEDVLVRGVFDVDRVRELVVDRDHIVGLIQEHAVWIHGDDTLCTCGLDDREHICEHIVAVALAWRRREEASHAARGISAVRP
jgi:hypothetical protein